MNGVACAACGRPRPHPGTPASEALYCSIDRYRAGHEVDGPDTRDGRTWRPHSAATSPTRTTTTNETRATTAAHTAKWGTLQSIVTNHALVDGNRRLGWLATAVFLEINDASVGAATSDAVYDLVMAAATSHRDVHRIASRLEQLAQRP